MPEHDGTGPRNKGPISGRGIGYCAVSLAKPEEELEYLKTRSQVLAEELKYVRSRIKSLEKPVNQGKKSQPAGGSLFVKITVPGKNREGKEPG